MELNIANFLINYEIPKKKGSERIDILKQIYSFYDTEQEKIHTKKSNWKRYVQYLKSNKIHDSKEEQIKFKKSKMFLRKITDKSMASFWLSHIPTKDLYYVLSVVKDKTFRNESVGAYIGGLHNSQSYSHIGFDKKSD